MQYKKIYQFASFWLSENNCFLVLIKDDIQIEMNSPDADDDYIFSLAVKTNAKAIVCGEKCLLDWKSSPVKVISKNEFERLY